MKALFVVGAPGVGKTTLVRGLLGMSSTGELPLGSHLVPSPKWTVTPDVLAAGHYTGQTFDGADTVGYGDVVKTLAYWERELLPPRPSGLTIFDGDRFSHTSALDVVRMRIEVLCLHLGFADEEEIARRRRERGSSQNAAWVKGRVTKARRFANEHFAGRGRRLFLEVDGLSPGGILDATRKFVAGRRGEE